MKITKNITTYILILASIMSCEITDLNHLDNPNEINPNNSDPTLLLNSSQIAFVKAIAHNEDNGDGINVRAAESMRMQNLFGPYSGPFALNSTRLNFAWQSLYQECLQDISVMIPLARNKKYTGHIAIGKLIKAYAYVMLVDTWGDVPYSESNLGNANQTPKIEEGEAIYHEMLATINEAIELLNDTSSNIMPDDLFYHGDKNKWIKFANTLKFKMYVQMRLIGNYSNEINTLITAGLIENIEDDFEFKYSSTASATGESRHPYFALNYDADGADDYLTSYYVNLLLDDKGFQDPRLRYYFYRQAQGDPSFNFFWTRNHGDDSSIPQDAYLRTAYGLYPIGGEFDDDNFDYVDNTSGAQGAGIFPFLLSSYVKFLQAESALMSGTNGDPKTLLEEGIKTSMDKVLNFYPNLVNPDFASTQTEVDDYINYVLAQYDATTTDKDKLEIIIKEYYIALWGNGIESWNNYRRTSMPSDLSPHFKTPGEFPRSFMYPASEVSTNPNVNQQFVTTKVFWDNNPDILK